MADFFGRYVALSGQVITRAQAEQRMFAKLARPRFLTDMQPLLPTQQAEALTDQTTLQSFTSVFAAFIERLPGDTWLRTAEMRERFGVV
nr:hypothetical protein [Rhizobium leguminosarum]